MLRRALRRHGDAARIAALVLILASLWLQPAAAQAAQETQYFSEDDIAPARQALTGPAALQLIVTVNSQPTDKIIGFIDQGGGQFSATRRELEEIGLNPPGAGAPGQQIELDSIPDLAYSYDEANQQIDIVTSDENRIRKVFDARNRKDGHEAARSDYGAVLNYTVFAAGEADTDALAVPDFTGVNTTLDARLFSPYGVLSQSAVVGQTVGSDFNWTDPGVLRLDTTYTYADEEDLILYRAGDVISRGPDWSRPIRLGGLQAQRSFALRPDLVTQSLPSFSGSAAVPSTVDVYVNNAKAYSKDVGSGPFQINNLPVLTGAGSARVVVRDAAGRETEETLSFYTAPQLLKPGILDFSAEAGFARHDYGLESDGYGGAPVGLASIKAGVYDDVTVEAHAEGGDGLVNGGAGAIVRVGELGIVSAAASVSQHDGDTGYQLYGNFETKVGQFTFNARAQHAFNGYEDLASISTRGWGTALNGAFAPGGALSVSPPTAVDSIGVSFPLEIDDSTIGINLIHYEVEDRETSDFISATYSRSLFERATLFATGYADVRDRETAALYVGVNMPLDDGVSLSAGASRRGEQMNATVDVSKSLDNEIGSWGWRVRDEEGESSHRRAELSYRAQSARITGAVNHERGSLRGTLAIEGAVATIGGDVFTSNRIHDAFAVVDAGAPGVRVLRENNVVGETDEDGKILIPNLNSYHSNKISIDPLGLPVNADVSETHTEVMPAFRSGIFVDFQVQSSAAAAIVVLTDASGAFLPMGSLVTLDGANEPFMVGYDGETYITGLHANNTITVQVGEATCSANFAFQPQENVQSIIGPEVCQ